MPKDCLFSIEDDEYDDGNESDDEMLSTEEYKIHFSRLISDYIKSKKSVKMLPKMSRYQRFLVHQCANDFDISHVSEGKEPERYVVLRKVTQNPQLDSEVDMDDMCLGDRIKLRKRQ